MTQEINVILAKANWCGHCQHFEPIFKHSEGIYKNNSQLKDLSIKFKEYDLANDDEKNTFMLNHFNAMDKVSGYPTVLLNIKSKSNNKYLTIGHTIVDEKVSKNNRTDEAAKRFLQNISNALESEGSDNSVLHVQAGGSGSGYMGPDKQTIRNHQTSLEEEKYRKKYLKYKSKYLGLKI